MNQTELLKVAQSFTDRIQEGLRDFQDGATSHHGMRKVMDEVRRPVGNFLRGDDKGMDWRWGTLGGSGVQAALGGAGAAYVRAMFGKGSNPTGHAEIEADKWLRQHAASKGVGIDDGVQNVLNPKGNRVNEWMKKRENLQRKMPYYHHGEGTINLPEKLNSPDVLAHELGHAGQSFKMRMLHRIGAPVAALGAGGAAFTHDKNESFNNAILGTAGGLGVLGNELHASAKGSQLLGQAGMKGLSRFGSFKGVPTYALLAGLPMATYGAKKYFGGFDGQK